MKPTIESTITLIKKLHEGQLDKAGNPYWTHPIRVMNYLDPNLPDNYKFTALLHDTIEDCGINRDYLLAEGYDIEVVDAVVLLSRDKSKGSYIDWIHSIKKSKNDIAIKVKIADNQDNSDPERINQLPEHERSISNRYERSLKILQS